MSCSGRKIRQAKAGKSVSAVTSPSFPAAIASGIALTAAQRQSRPGAERSNGAIGNGRKHRRDRYPLGRNKSRKINASRTPHRGRTIYESFCLTSQNEKENIFTMSEAKYTLEKNGSISVQNLSAYWLPGMTIKEVIKGST